MAVPPVDPWSAGIMALGGIASSGPPAMTATSGNAVTYDNSGWSVNIGGGSATSTKTAIPTTAQAVGAATGAAVSTLSNPLVIIAIGVAVFLYLKHK